MESPQISVAKDESSVTVYLYGEVDFAASLELKPELERIVEDCDGDILLDLDEVTLLDSEGIKLLLGTAQQANRKNTRAKIVRCSERVRRILDLVGVEELIEVCESFRITS